MSVGGVELQLDLGIDCCFSLIVAVLAKLRGSAATAGMMSRKAAKAVWACKQ